MNIKISIIIPVYNTGKYLEKCLNSVISQNLREIEIIIINDCSTDNSLNIIEKYKKIDNRIILINKEKNEGLSAARNSGLEISKGEYILHIDSDDWIEQNYFKDMYEIAIKYEADMVISDYYTDFNNGKIFYIQDQKEIKNFKINRIKTIENIFLSKAYPCVWNKLIRIKLYKDNKIKHPKEISLGEDLAVTPRLIYDSNKIIKLNKAYYHYIQNPLSITKTDNKKKIYDIYEALKINKKFFQNCKEKISINELMINHLTVWLFQIKYDFNDKKYTEILNEYINILRKIEIVKLKNTKLKIIKIIFMFFKSKYIFSLIWNIRSISIKRLRLKKYLNSV